MNSMELEEIVGTLILTQDRRKIIDPRAQPGMTVRLVDGYVGPVEITKLVYGTWRHFIKGYPSFTSDENIQEVLSDVEREIKAGDEYYIKIFYQGQDRIVKAKVVTQFSPNPDTSTYLRVIDPDNLTGYLCATSTRKLMCAKNLNRSL